MQNVARILMSFLSFIMGLDFNIVLEKALLTGMYLCDKSDQAKKLYIVQLY